MKTLKDIIAIIDSLDCDTYSALYESEEALTKVGLTKAEFDAYCSAEDFPEGDTKEDWLDPVWDE